MEKLKNILLSENCSQEICKNEEYVFSVIPELEKCKGFEQRNPWHIYDVYNHILKVLDGVPCEINIRIAALFHDIGKPETCIEDEEGIRHFYNHWNKSVEIFERYSSKLIQDKNQIKTIINLIYYHDINFDKMTNEDKTNIAQIFSDEEIKMLFTLKRADLLAQSPKYIFLLKDYDRQEQEILQLNNENVKGFKKKYLC